MCAASVFVIAWVLLLGPVYGDADDAGNFAVTFASPLLCLILACAVGPAVVPIRRSAWPVGLAALAVLAAITTAEMATALARVSDAAPSLAWVLAGSRRLPAARGGPVERPYGRAADSEDEDEPERSVRQSTSSLIAAVPLILVVVATGSCSSA